jgi:2-polyprenyl-6-methoxyphenol hydroxylase-like FAD-dependent oxidoreductase
MTHIGAHAIVLGASLAGLTAAAALAERFDRVTIVERDGLPANGQHRRGVPQGRHGHVLLPAGLLGLAELFPGIVDDLRGHGAHIIDATEFRFHIAGGNLRLNDPELQRLHSVGATRPHLEAVVRARVRALAHVKFVDDQDARGLVTTTDRARVTGVRVRPRNSDRETSVLGDLVVDATGRGSRSPHWLAAMGYDAPDEERFNVGVHYTTRLFHRRPTELDQSRHVVATIPPHGRRGGFTLAIEQDRWLVTLVGLLGERPPTDLAAFVEYARTVASADLYQLVSGAAPAGEAVTGAFPAYLRHRYDRLRRFPGRYVVLGDAVCSLNPVYAQGMSLAVREAAVLGQVLDRYGPDRAGPAFFRRANPLVESAWTLATSADLAHPDIEGPRTVGWKLLDRYVDRLLHAAHEDPVVAGAYLRVIAMVAPPQRMLHPRIAWRVWRRAHPGGRQAQQPVR